MGIILIGILMLVVGYLLCKFIRNGFLGDTLGVTLIVLSIAALVCSILAIIVTNINKNALVEGNKQVYKSLYYQVETGMYNNDNEVGKKELVNQVAEWNKDLAVNRYFHNSFWTNVFYPVDYDRFEYIPIELIK